jgi:hypothetical protein
MKQIIISIAIFALTACAATKDTNSWHWEKSGSSQNELIMDNGQCKAQALSGTGGVINLGTILILDACMHGKGWQKVSDR